MNTERPTYIKAAYALILIYLLIYGIILLKPLLVPLLFAALFASLFLPVVNLLERWHINKLLSIIITLLIAVMVLGGLIYLIYWQLSGFVADLPVLGERLTLKLSELQSFIHRHTSIKINIEIENIKQSAIALVQNYTDTLSSAALSLLGGITVFLLIPVYLFLFLLFRSFLLKFVLLLFENNNTEFVRSMTEKIQKVAQRYVAGMFLVAIILSTVNSSMLLIMGIEHAIFFGVFAGLLNIIPYLGPLMGSLLPIFFAWLVKDSIWYPLGIAMYFYVAQLLEGYLLTPAIVGRTVNINPLVVIIALISGYFIWGVIGMILIIPAVAILKIIFDEIDSLKSIGFLIGGIPDTSKKNRFYAKLESIKQKFSRKKNND